MSDNLVGGGKKSSQQAYFQVGLLQTLENEWEDPVSMVLSGLLGHEAGSRGRNEGVSRIGQNLTVSSYNSDSDLVSTAFESHNVEVLRSNVFGLDRLGLHGEKDRRKLVVG